ncbi:hypothetical protein [Pseudarthrobacter siccitolerans]
MDEEFPHDVHGAEGMREAAVVSSRVLSGNESQLFDAAQSLHGRGEHQFHNDVSAVGRVLVLHVDFTVYRIKNFGQTNFKTCRRLTFTAHCPSFRAKSAGR